MSWVDQLEKQEILERHSPYWFDLCAFCGSYEGESHEADCNWIRIRTEASLEVAA